MSGGTACRNRAQHRPSWRVETRRANYSAFNGGRRTPSDYSQLICRACGARWRTKAAYVGQIPDEGSAGVQCSRCRRGTAAHQCRICRDEFCPACWADHHHEGNGTPATDTR